MSAIISNWCVAAHNPYKAPEEQSKCISGTVTGSEKFDDGATIITSSIKSATQDADGVVSLTTYTGSVYVLGAVDPNYEAQYSDAKERLLKYYGQ
jgi:hypothetical protein